MLGAARITGGIVHVRGAARGAHRARLHPRPGRSVLHAAAGRSGRARAEGRAAGRGRRHTPRLRAAGGGTRRPGHLLRADQRRQAERRPRPRSPARARGGARPRARRRRGRGELPAGRGRPPGLRLHGPVARATRHRLLLDLRLRPDRPAARLPGVPPHHQRHVGRHAPRAPDRCRAAHRLFAVRRRAVRDPRLRRDPGRPGAAGAHRAGRLSRRLHAGGADRGRGHHVRRRAERRCGVPGTAARDDRPHAGGGATW
jgi:hypothetical protein